MTLLTYKQGSAIMESTSPHAKFGIETPAKASLGHIFLWLFYAHLKRKRHLAVSICYGGLYEAPISGGRTFAGSLNLVQPVTQRLRPKGGGLSIHKGATTP